MKTGVQQYLDVELTVMGLLLHLAGPSCDLDAEPLAELPADVLQDLVELTPDIPLERRSPRRDPRDYERMAQIHRLALAALARKRS